MCFGNVVAAAAPHSPFACVRHGRPFRLQSYVISGINRHSWRHFLRARSGRLAFFY